MAGINPFGGGDSVATKKDYELVADAIRYAMREHSRDGSKIPAAFAHRVITSIADQFARANPSFNRSVFYKRVTLDDFFNKANITE